MLQRPVGPGPPVRVAAFGPPIGRGGQVNLPPEPKMGHMADGGIGHMADTAPRRESQMPAGVAAWIAGAAAWWRGVLGGGRAAGGRRPDRPPQDEPPAAGRALSIADLAAAREEEREILSYDLHDGLAQYVLAAQMHLDTFAALRADEAERAEGELDHARLRLRQAAREIHRTVSALSLRVPPEDGLGHAVREHMDQLRETHGWTGEVDDRLDRRPVPAAVAAMVLRIVQEALANAARHAEAQRVEVSLRFEGQCLVAVVRDWGIGFAPERAPRGRRHVGLRSMGSRAELLGGSCTVASAPGQGTTVTVRAPCPQEEVGGNVP